MPDDNTGHVTQSSDNSDNNQSSQASSESSAQATESNPSWPSVNTSESISAIRNDIRKSDDPRPLTTKES